MKFRPLEINYQHEALHYQEEQLRGHFFHVPYSVETNVFHVGVNVTYTQCTVPPSFVTNVSRRPLHDKNIYASSEFSCSNILKTKAGINFIIREDVPHEHFCFSKEDSKENNDGDRCDFIQDKNVALLTLPHSYHFKTNEKLNEIMTPDSVSALISLQQGQRKRNKRHSMTEFSCLAVSHRLLLPENFIGCIIAVKSTTASERNKSNHDWLSKRKDIWALQRELIKSKRLARKQMPWWYYYYQRKNPTYTELVPPNLTVLRLDMRLPLLDFANATVPTADSTTIRKPFLPWIKSLLPSTKTTKRHQGRECHESVLTLDFGKHLEERENLIFHQNISLDEEISSCLCDFCTTSVGSVSCIKKIINDVALPPHKEVDNTENRITDENYSLSIPSAVSAALLIIPQKRMCEPNDGHLTQTHGTNFIVSKRFSEIMTPDSSGNSHHAFMLLPHKYQLTDMKTSLHKSGMDNTPSHVSMKNFCIIPSESCDHNDNQILPQPFSEEASVANEKKGLERDLHLSELAKDCNRERKLMSDVKLQLMTGCFIQPNDVPCAYHGFLTGDIIDASTYHSRYRNVYLRQNEVHSKNYMVNLAFQLQALTCVNLTLLLPAATSPRKSPTTEKIAFPSDEWLPKFLLKNRRNPESKIKKLPTSLTIDSAVTLTDKKVNMTTESLLTTRPREFNQILLIHSTVDFSLNAYGNWLNGNMLEFVSSAHDTLALRSELTHLMTKAYELVSGRKSVNSIFCDRGTYHHDVKGMEVEVMGLTLPTAEKTRFNDILRNNKRRQHQEPEDCAILQEDNTEKEELNKAAEKKRRTRRLGRESFAQDVGESEISVTNTDGLEGGVPTDDNVRKTAPLNVDEAKPAITRAYEECQNGTTDGFCREIAEDFNTFLSRDDMKPFKTSKATPMTDPCTRGPATPPMCNLEETSNRVDCNSVASGIVTSVQTLHRNVSQSMMDNFFNLMGRSRREKENKCDDNKNYIPGAKDSTLDKLIHQQPVSTIKSASNKTKHQNNHDNIAFSENTSATNASIFHQLKTPINVLCSGHFLENFSETVANLGSGLWSRTNNESSGGCIMMFDSPVVDFVGVDIELPDSSGIICVRLSQLKNSHDNCVKTFTKRVLYLASIGRYSKLWVYVVCDADITRSVSMDLFMLQNTLVMKQNCYCPCEKMAVCLTSLPALSSCIALLILEHSSINDSCGKNNPEELLGKLGSLRKKIQERAIFLISLIPSYTALDALSCIHSVCLENCETNATPSPPRVEEAFTNFLLCATAVSNGNDSVSRVRLIGASKMAEKSLLNLSTAMKWNLVNEYNFQVGK